MGYRRCASHSSEDEFVYILEGEPVFATNVGETAMRLGSCRFQGPLGQCAHLVNRTEREMVYLEIGDRDAVGTVIYPYDDLGKALAPDGSRVFVHKDGRPY